MKTSRRGLGDLSEHKNMMRRARNRQAAVEARISELETHA